MAQFPPFVIPAGVVLRVTEQGLHLSYDGDIDLQEAPGMDLALVEAGGDLEVRMPRVTGSFRAGGTLRIRGDIRGGRLHARHVFLGRQRIDCLAITAIESITIGHAHITADAIIAPTIQLDPKAHGRVTVIESRNDRGATKIKGGFSIADYDDMFGNVDEFLGSRGLARISDGPPSRPPAPRLPIDEIDDDVEDTGPGVATTPARSGGPRAGGYSVPNTPTTWPPPAAPPTFPPPPGDAPRPGATPAAIRPLTDEEDDDPSLSVSFGSMEPMVPDAAPTPAADTALQQQLSDALGRIVSCYEGADLPPAVEQLRSLVEHRDYDALREDITDVWNGLLVFHQQRGIRPHHQVTHAFNVIHGLVQS